MLLPCAIAERDYEPMRVRFTPEALAHVAAVRSYLEVRSEPAAGRVVARIFVETDRLGSLPWLGHPGQVPGTRERTVPGLPYIVVYELGIADQIIVLGVFHGAQAR